MDTKKVFLSGSVRRNPKAKEQFKKAELNCFKKYSKVSVFNPTTQDWSDMSEEEIMTICLEYLLASDIVIMLKNWEESENASLENRVAIVTGKKVVYENKDE